MWVVAAVAASVVSLVASESCSRGSRKEVRNTGILNK
jgi:hypothetical protein